MQTGRNFLYRNHGFLKRITILIKNNGQLIAYVKSIPLRTGRPQTAATTGNEQIVEDLICSQEESPGSHMAPRKTEKHTGISGSSMKQNCEKN